MDQIFINQCRPMNKFNLITLGFSCLLLFLNNSLAQPNDLSSYIAFLKKGDIWISDTSSQNQKQITSDSGKVQDFQFSPLLKYLAYSRIISYVDEPGLWDDTGKVPQRAISSIVIMDLQTKKIIKEIMPVEDTWIYISKWLPNNKLLYYSSSGFDVSGYYVYDIQSDIKREVEYDKARIINSSDYSDDGTLMVYVDDSALGKDYKENIHLFNIQTNTDKILVSKKNINDIKISNDKNQVAFIEVTETDEKYFDNLWVYNIRKDSLGSLYRGPASAKTGNENEISWSFDDQYIGIFFPPQALIITVGTTDNIQRIKGADFTWIENGKIIFSQGNNIYFYSLNTHKSNLLIEDAAEPFFLRKKSY